MAPLPGRYKNRKRRSPKSSGGRCRACGATRDRDEAAQAKAAGRGGLCRACLFVLSVPIVRAVVA